ncbi:hypothetical protein D9Q98_004070 [Chlorella vulgaris]|uniref:Uncharacterized protein n=1 Tax=Chlorella vulgaris TaxID=3077 RepID=A0A9D4YY79_CHLVU|nr:hypothetical protein D9Q98_004070 [Chlorella vulgaris]
MQFTLVQQVIRDGSLGTHCALLVPTDQIGAETLSLLARVNGSCIDEEDDDTDKAMFDEAWALMEVMSGTLDVKAIVVPAGASITHVCQVFR